LTKYIADNSFAIITTTGSPITENMIKEMLRIIKKSASSAIIIYGYEEKDALRKLLKTKLEENKFIENPSYKFSKKLSEPSSRPIVAFTYKVEQEQTEQTQVKPGSPRQEFDTEVNPRSRR